MELNDAINEARKIMDDLGLIEWNFEISKTRATLADCAFNSQTIRMSKHFISYATEHEFNSIMAHECAHALLPPGEGHGKEWKKLCLALGGDGRREPDADTFLRKTSLYVIQCPEGEILGYVNKRVDRTNEFCLQHGKIVKVVGNLERVS